MPEDSGYAGEAGVAEAVTGYANGVAGIVLATPLAPLDCAAETRHPCGRIWSWGGTTSSCCDPRHCISSGRNPTHHAAPQMQTCSGRGSLPTKSRPILALRRRRPDRRNPRRTVLDARLTFADVVGFRVLDERDLCEFWNEYSEPNGWLYEVESGGWLDLEKHRQLFNSPDLIQNLREYLLVDDKCVSVLCVAPPEIVDLGTDPARAQ